MDRIDMLDKIFELISKLSDDELDRFLHLVEKGKEACDAMQIVIFKRRKKLREELKRVKA